MPSFRSPHAYLKVAHLLDDGSTEVISFHEHVFVTTDRRKSKLLREHEGFGRYIFLDGDDLPEPETAPVPEKVYPCAKCGQVFPTLQALGRHSRKCKDGSR